MANRVYGYQGYRGYQFETSPKKIQPEYEPTIEKNKKKTVESKTVNKKDVEKEQESKMKTPVKKMSKEELNKKMKLVCYIAFGFAVLFTISYRNSIINEKFSQKEGLKAELAEIQKINEQLEVGIENELNLTNVEAIAKDRLGMAKLDNSQKVYINLPKKEYVEATTEGIKYSESQPFYQVVINKVKEILNIN